jgi:hypothetical protein
VTTFSDRLYQLGGVPVGGPITQGKVFFVKPVSGSDTSSGKNPQQALKTLAAALALATANQNDIIYLLSEGNASALATDYQATTLDWNKDGVSLIGINAGGTISPRSRIAWTAGTNVPSTSPNLFTLSANNCTIEGISIFAGIADADALGAVVVTGHRNVIRRCHLAGIGHDTQDVSGAYSVKMSGGTENLFDDSTIGVDTIARGTAANSAVLFAAVANGTDTNARNIFRNCRFLQYAEATNAPMVKRDTSGSDRFNLFQWCQFINTGTSVGAQVFALTAGGSPSGFFLHHQCAAYRFDNLETTPSGVLFGLGEVDLANTGLAGVTS